MKQRKIGLLVSVLGLALGVWGCQRQQSGTVPGGTSTGRVNPAATIKVGYVPIADCLQLYVAAEKGMFAKNGLSVQLIPLQSGTKIIEAIVGGSVNAGVSSVVPAIVAHTKGVPIVGITGGPLETEAKKTHALIVLAGSPSKDAKDLVGKTVAVNALHNIEHVALQLYLEKHGVPLDRVKVVEAPFPQMEGVLKSGSADAVMAIEPFVTLALSHKTVRILGHPYTETRPRSVVSTYVVRKDWLDGNRDTAHKFAGAIADATDYIAGHDAEVRQMLLKYTKIPQDVIGKVVLPEYQAKFQPSDLQPWVDELARQKIIAKPYPAKEAFEQQ